MEILILIVVLVLSVLVGFGVLFGLFMLNEMNQTLEEIKFMVEEK